MEKFNYIPEELVQKYEKDKQIEKIDQDNDEILFHDLKEKKENLINQINNLEKQKQEIDKELNQYLEKNIDIEKISVFSCSSTDHKYALPSGEYYYLSINDLPENIVRLTASSSYGIKAILEDQKEIDLPEDAVIISKNKESYNEESYYGTNDCRGGEEELFEFFTENPEYINRYKRH